MLYNLSEGKVEINCFLDNDFCIWRVYEVKTRSEKSSCEAYQNFQANKLDFHPKNEK